MPLDKMRCVENPDDFFAPRPKLSWSLRMIRAVAFAAAVMISAPIFVLEALMFYSVQENHISLIHCIVTFAAATTLQLFLLILCWRAWMLRVWACDLLAYLLIGFTLGSMGISSWLAIFLCLIVVLFLLGMRGEMGNLKSGF